MVKTDIIKVSFSLLAWLWSLRFTNTGEKLVRICCSRTELKGLDVEESLFSLLLRLKSNIFMECSPHLIALSFLLFLIFFSAMPIF